MPGPTSDWRCLPPAKNNKKQHSRRKGSKFFFMTGVRVRKEPTKDREFDAEMEVGILSDCEKFRAENTETAEVKEVVLR